MASSERNATNGERRKASSKTRRVNGKWRVADSGIQADGAVRRLAGGVGEKAMSTEGYATKGEFGNRTLNDESWVAQAGRGIWAAVGKRRTASGERRAASKLQRVAREKREKQIERCAREKIRARTREKKASARTREIEIDDGRGAD